MRSTFKAPADFSFKRTVLSHGWCRLAPFHTDATVDRLHGVIALTKGGAVSFTLSCPTTRVTLKSGDSAIPIREAVRRILNLDQDLSDFYSAARECEGFGWIADQREGRLLRAPTAWEDLVKLILTTNCSWELTKRMVASLVEHYGEPAADGRRAFPRPEALASAGARALRERNRTGYRAPLLARLAREVADGAIDPESWERSPLDRADLRKELLELPGVGPYVAESMLKLIGRPAGLALDCALRSKYAQVYHGGRAVSDRTIARRYSRMGDWGGLALWCDMTRDWMEEAR